MTRFVKQRDRFRCGPIVILNAMRFFGSKKPYSFAQKSISKRLKCRQVRGTKATQVDRGLRHYGKGLFKVTRCRQWSLDRIDDALRKNKAVVVHYYYACDGHMTGHYVLLVRDKYHGYFTVNNSRARTLEPFTFNSFRPYEQHSNMINYVWILSKCKR